MKKELLSPAGDFECLKAAVHAGADAIYIGGKKFGARKFASNFDDNEICDAINYCHLYGVKLYITINIMIYENEMEEVLEYVGFLYKNNIDAVIVQDVGLICEIRKIYPDLEIHASTQMHNNSVESCKILEELGIKRVVLAREMTLDEVSSLNTILEKEVFIHGAICISYSGQCLFSSLVLNRSGNRGECAGMCRLPYSLKSKKGKFESDVSYLLSPRELCTIQKFEELMKSDVKCFKIEGRMKSPSYVYYITHIYRKLIDKFENGETLKITEEEYENMLSLYNRKFTLGHLFSTNEKDFMNIESPNHLGIPLGKVIDVNDKKIKILLEKDLHQFDGIRFLENNKGMIVNFLYNKNNLLVSNAKKDDVIYVDNKVGLKNKSTLVSKTQDSFFNEQLMNYPLKKIALKMKLIAKIGEKLTLEVSDFKNTFILEDIILESAKSMALTKEEIYNHLNRLGNTVYKLDMNDCHIIMDENVFIPLKNLNNLRRTLIEKITISRISKNNVSILGKYVPKSEKVKEKKVNLCCLVRSKEQLLEVVKYNVNRIYVADFELYKAYKDSFSNLYYRQERLVKYNQEPVSVLNVELANNIYNDKKSVVCDYYLNVANTSYLTYLSSKNVDCATMSVELTPKQIQEIARKNDSNIKLEVIIYGRIELMIMKYCPVSYLLKCQGQCLKTCQNYCLVDRNKKEYPLLSKNKITHLFSYQKNWYSENELEEIISSGIDFVRLEFFDESLEEIANILTKVSKKI